MIGNLIDGAIVVLLCSALYCIIALCHRLYSLFFKESRRPEDRP